MMIVLVVFLIASQLYQTSSISYSHRPTTANPPNAEMRPPTSVANSKEDEVKSNKLTEEDFDIESAKIQNDEIETLFIDQIETKINDFRDLKTQVAVLDRHLRKHSDFVDFNSTDHMLVDLDDKVLKPYEDGLKVLKNTIAKSNHRIISYDVNLVNSVVDKAEIFLEAGREMVESALDTHLTSDEHKNEHVHGVHGHSEDHMSDYADLISLDEEVIIEDQELLLDYIDMEIEDFETIKKQAVKYEKHITEHILDHVSHDHSESLELKIAENVLQDLNLQTVDTYEESLKALKTRINNAGGKLKVKTIDQIAASMEDIEVFINATREKLELVELLDEEFEETSHTHSEDKSHLEILSANDRAEVPSGKHALDQAYHEEEVSVIVEGVLNYASREKLEDAGSGEKIRNESTKSVKPVFNLDHGHVEKVVPEISDKSEVVTNPGEQFSNDTKDVFKQEEAKDELKKVAENSDILMNSEKSSRSYEVKKEEIVLPPFTFHFSLFSLAMTILAAVVLIGAVSVMAAFMCGCRRKKEKLDKEECREIVNGEESSETLKFESTRLETVKENDGWNSKNWVLSHKFISQNNA